MKTPPEDPGSGGGGGWIPISTTTTTAGVTSVEITADLDSTYDVYVIGLSGLETGNTFGPQMQFSTDGGSTYDTSTTMYWSNYTWTSSSAASRYTSSTSGYAKICGGNGIHMGVIYLHNLSNVGKKQWSSDVTGASGSQSGQQNTKAHGYYGNTSTATYSDTTAAVNALKIYTQAGAGFDAGGKITLYGIKTL